MQNRTPRIGVSIAHQQDRWPLDPNKPNLFAPRSGRLDQRWSFRELRDENRFIATDMAELSGLILGSPFRAAMSAHYMTEIVEWVQDGGRLLLLGYELGDRHHNANLNALAQRFGLHPMPDIVGPALVARGQQAEKPFGKRIALYPTAADPHELTQGISELRWANLQTVMVEPEATAWLKVGGNAIYRTAHGTEGRHFWVTRRPVLRGDLRCGVGTGRGGSAVRPLRSRCCPFHRHLGPPAAPR